MMKTSFQLDLFHNKSLNTTYEIKRSMRLAISKSHLSREEIIDQMNKVAVQEGMRTTISKATLDNWIKDSDPGRLPSPAWLTIFCYVLHDTGPVVAMVHPLNCIVLGGDTQKLLAWAEAEFIRRKAVKKARVALTNLEEV